MSKSISSSEPYLKLTVTNATSRSAPVARVKTVCWNVAKSVAAYAGELVCQRALRRMEYELERLDDRTLKDIGMDRSEIRRHVRFGRGF
ncbi:MAG: DUF1127 domain-containing protein [Hyphomicrobiaceae bacterium]